MVTGVPLRAGASSIDVTPAAGVVMQGYDARHADGIDDPLVASALAVASDRVEWLLVTVDCIGLDREFTARVRT